MLFAGLLFAMRPLTQPASCIQSGNGKSPLEYLSEEKFMPFATTDEYFAQPPSSEEYPFTVCGQTVMLSNPDLAPLPCPLSGNRAGNHLPVLL